MARHSFTTLPVLPWHSAGCPQNNESPLRPHLEFLAAPAHLHTCTTQPFYSVPAFVRLSISQTHYDHSSISLYQQTHTYILLSDVTAGY